MPPSRIDLRDQLRRAAGSILLNIAEGASEYSQKEKARFYRYARRSAAECQAALDLVAIGCPSAPVPPETHAKLQEVSAMLTALIDRLGGGASPSPPASPAP